MTVTIGWKRMGFFKGNHFTTGPCLQWCQGKIKAKGNLCRGAAKVPGQIKMGQNKAKGERCLKLRQRCQACLWPASYDNGAKPACGLLAKVSLR